MKKIYSLSCTLLFASFLSAQTICSPVSNLILFSNYDGGTLNINLNAPMGPGIKIGVCTYEGTNIVISGIGAPNVSAVTYAGFNASNAHCGSVINTNITGTPGGCVNTILFAPAVTYANPNGNGSMVCAYSCNNNVNQGGCNTADQVEAFFLNHFPGSSIYMHKTQYGCWTGTQDVSNGGTCCASPTGVTTIDIEPFMIYPNPAENVLNITALGGIANSSFQLFSVDGKLVKGKTTLSESVDISGLEAGIYFIEVSDGSYITRKRFVKN
jgi:hypothetical protein